MNGIVTSCGMGVTNEGLYRLVGGSDPGYRLLALGWASRCLTLACRWCAGAGSSRRLVRALAAPLLARVLAYPVLRG
jgi:hypothetical protein